MLKYPPSAKAKMVSELVMNGQNLRDAVGSVVGFHINEDTSAERSEVICSKLQSRSGRGRTGTPAVLFWGTCS